MSINQKSINSRFPRLPLLEEAKVLIARSIDLSDLRNTMLVGCQHLLESTGSLVETLIELGLPPEQIVLCGKSYSTNSEVASQLQEMGVQLVLPNQNAVPGSFTEGFNEDIRKMWELATVSVMAKSINQILILDDGARSISTMPEKLHQLCRIGAIEQTTFGVREAADSSRKISTVLVAASAAKRILESPMIASAITQKIEKYGFLVGRQRKCGIIGMGAIGKSVANKLLSMGHLVQSYDPNDDLSSVNSTANLISSSEIIFGCSGFDISEYFFNLRSQSHVVRSQKILVSCSSEDKEFNQLIRNFCIDRSLLRFNDDLSVECHGVEYQILNGGLPINFDRSPTSVPNHEIQLTRALLLVGVLQAYQEMISLKTAEKKLLMLSPSWQQEIVNSWRKVSRKNDNEEFKIFDNMSQIIFHSGGSYPGPLPVLRSSEASKPQQKLVACK